MIARLQICELFFIALAIYKKGCIIDNREVWGLARHDADRPQVKTII